MTMMSMMMNQYDSSYEGVYYSPLYYGLGQQYRAVEVAIPSLREVPFLLRLSFPKTRQQANKRAMSVRNLATYLANKQ